MATKDHLKHHQLGVKHPSGLAPSILCMLAHFHGLLALPGCLKWTILPPPKAYVEKSFREPQFLYFTIKTKDTNRMNPCTSSLLTSPFTSKGLRSDTISLTALLTLSPSSSSLWRVSFWWRLFSFWSQGHLRPPQNPSLQNRDQLWNDIHSQLK